MEENKKEPLRIRGPIKTSEEGKLLRSYKTKGDTGPTTPWGKFRATTYFVKNPELMKFKHKKGSILAQMAEQAKCSTCQIKDSCPYFDPQDAGCRVRYIAFVRSVKEGHVKDFDELDELYRVLRTNIDLALVQDLQENKPLNPQTLKAIKMASDMLVQGNKAKFGEKRVEMKIGYKDFERAMFNRKELDEQDDVEE